jgi:hypothetical protein
MALNLEVHFISKVENAQIGLYWAKTEEFWESKYV